jgi:hypothetical protein
MLIFFTKYYYFTQVIVLEMCGTYRMHKGMIKRPGRCKQTSGFKKSKRKRARVEPVCKWEVSIKTSHKEMGVRM